MSNYIKLEPRKPQVIALKNLDCLKVKGFHGPELRWQLSDGRSIYTPLDFADKLKTLDIAPNQRFTIERGKDGVNVAHLPDLRGRQAAAVLVEKAPDLDGPDITPRKPMETVLERALKSAVQACAEAEKHGKEIGYSVRFTPSDVRALGITLLIGMQNGRAA